MYLNHKKEHPMAGSSPRKILVVDDLSDMRNILRITLERDGWTVIEAATGTQAVGLIEGEKPDVILMDYNMPEMNGIDACHTIKHSSQSSHIPVLIYTGAGSESARDAAMQAGAVDFLLKPLMPADLRAIVNQVYNS